MQLDSNTTEPVDAGGAAPLPEEGASSTRTFILLAIPLVVVFLCIAAGLAFYALVWGPQQRVAKETQAAGIVLTNTQIAMLNANIQKTAAVTATPVPPTATATVAPSDTPLPVNSPQAGGIASPTPLLAFTATNTPLAAAASNTPAVATTVTPSPTKAGPTPTKVKASATPVGFKTATPTQLPGTGFADEAGVPMLIVLTVALVGVAVIVRRVRLSLR